MTSTAQTFIKDPDALLDYGFNFGIDADHPEKLPWLATGETITDSVWTVPAGLTRGIDSASATITLIWLSGGTAGVSYLVSNKITTSAGRVDERSFLILVGER